jgi:hypothetical protein
VLATASPEELVSRRLDELERAISVEPDTNPLLHAARLEGELRDIFDEEVTLSIPELTSARSGLKPLVAIASKAALHYQTLELSFDSRKIEVDEESGTATARVRGRAVAEHAASRYADERRIDFDFVLRDGEWRIGSVDVAERESD